MKLVTTEINQVLKSICLFTLFYFNKPIDNNCVVASVS